LGHIFKTANESFIPKYFYSTLHNGIQLKIPSLNNPRITNLPTTLISCKCGSPGWSILPDLGNSSLSGKALELGSVYKNRTETRGLDTVALTWRSRFVPSSVRSCDRTEC
jgi:hypothetical protein